MVNHTQFDVYATTYDDSTPIQTQVAKELSNKIYQHFHQMNKPQTWIDIGCGTGKLSRELLQQYPVQQKNIIQLIGLDNSQNMLNIWRKNIYQIAKQFDKNTIVSVTAIRSEMQYIPLTDNSIDMLVSSFSLHWQEPNILLKLVKLLKKQAYIHIAVPVAGSFFQVQQRFPLLPIYPFLTVEAWKSVILQVIQHYHGKILYQQVQSFHHTYPNLHQLLRELKKMGGAVSLKQPLATATLRQYLADTQQIQLDYQVLFIGIYLNADEDKS